MAHPQSKRQRSGVVTATNPETGKMAFIAPDEALPEWFPEITNESAFVGEEQIEEAREKNSYKNKTVPQLLKLAEDREIEILSTKKADIISALEADDADDD